MFTQKKDRNELDYLQKLHEAARKQREVQEKEAAPRQEKAAQLQEPMLKQLGEKTPEKKDMQPIQVELATVVKKKTVKYQSPYLFLIWLWAFYECSPQVVSPRTSAAPAG
jgi:hypothetical protein